MLLSTNKRFEEKKKREKERKKERNSERKEYSSKRDSGTRARELMIAKLLSSDTIHITTSLGCRHRNYQVGKGYLEALVYIPPV